MGLLEDIATRELPAWTWWDHLVHAATGHVSRRVLDDRLTQMWAQDTLRAIHRDRPIFYAEKQDA